MSGGEGNGLLYFFAACIGIVALSMAAGFWVSRPRWRIRVVQHKRPYHIAMKIAELHELIARAGDYLKQLERDYPSGPENVREEVAPYYSGGLDCLAARLATAIL